MYKFKDDFETIRYPLIVMFLMVSIRGVSNTILSDLVSPLISGNFLWVISLMEILQYFSAVIIQYLPFLIVMKVLTKRHNSQRVIIMYFVSYILLLTITMALGKTNLPAIVYNDLFGIRANYNNALQNTTILLTPYRIGLIGAMISGVIVNFSFKATRSRTRYGLLTYIDKDILGTLLTLIITLVVGIGFTFVWPYVIDVLFKIFEWIAQDITNPISTFVYGFLDQVLSLFDLNSMNRQSFWFTSMGGSWINPAGETVIGDVSIWSSMIQSGVYNTGFGRFITPSYIINLFAIPGLIVGLYSVFTNAQERRKHISLVVLAILLSWVSDISLPLLLFLVIKAPLLYAMILFIFSSLYAILHGMNIFLGSVFASKAPAAIGNGVEFFSYLKNPELAPTITTLIIVGAIVFGLMFIITNFYYRVISVGLINKFEIDERTDEFLEIVGGLENIEEIDSSPFRIEVKLNRPQMFNYERLEDTTISRVIETRTIYAIYYGTASTLVRKEVLLRMKISELAHEES